MPLLNESNTEAILVFNKDAVNFKINGYFQKGLYDRVELLEDVEIKNGKSDSDLKLKGKFKWIQTTLDEEIKKGTIFWVKTEKFAIRYERNEVRIKTPSNIINKTECNVGTNEDANKDIQSLFQNEITFNYPKPVSLVRYLINMVSDKNAITLDYFAGSGTTGHATIKLNREDDGSRKYILVEMGGYFDTVTKPRIQKVIYTDSWKDGKPQDREGISQLVKYQVLESYEDALNNLQLPDKSSESLLNFDEQAQEEYLLNYMLDVESRDHLFNIQMFRNPFNYQLKVTENNELVPTKVDLVETFNYLIGLYVERMQRVGDIKFIEGKTREGVKTLVIWRNVETTTNEETAKKFRKIYDSIRSSEFDQIYINGDHHFDNMRTGEDTFKVKLIEETFFKQMFNISEL